MAKARLLKIKIKKYTLASHSDGSIIKLSVLLGSIFGSWPRSSIASGTAAPKLEYRKKFWLGDGFVIAMNAIMMSSALTRLETVTMKHNTSNVLFSILYILYDCVYKMEIRINHNLIELTY